MACQYLPRSDRQMAFALALIAVGFAASGALAAEDKSKQKKPGAVPTAEAQSPAVAPTPGPSIAPAASAQPAVPAKLNDTKPAWTVSCFSTARTATPSCR